MKILKKLQLKIADIDIPYSLEEIWLSYQIPNKTKYNGRVLRLKEYPEEGEIVHLFSTKKYKIFYKTTKVNSDRFGSDLAYWDNGRKYSFEFNNFKEIKS